MPQRVLFLSNTLNAGGSERNVAFFCEQLDRSRYVPEVWLLQGGGQFEQQVLASGTAIRNLNRKRAFGPLFTLKAAYAIAHAPVDIVHAFHPAIAFYAGLAKSLWGLPGPLIFSLGTTVHPPSINSWLHEHYMLQQIDRVFVNSESVRQFAKDLGHPPQQTDLLENGHHLEPFTREFARDALRRELGWTDDTLGIVCVGRLIDTKRYCDLVDTIQILKTRGLPVKAIFVGDGPLRRDLEQQIATLSLQHEIQLLGYRKEVANYLRAADLFAFPSIVEGLPNSVIEAQLAGLPMVAANIPGVRDVIQDGVTGILTEPQNPTQMADQIAALWQDPQRRKQLGEAALIQSRLRFGANTIATRLADLYDNVLALRKSH